MKTLKTIPALITVLLALCADRPARGAELQDSGTFPSVPTVVTNQSTNVVAAGTWLDVAGAKKITVYVSDRAISNSAAAGTNLFYWSLSPDTLTYTTQDPATVVAVAYNGTNLVGARATFDLGGAKFIRFDRAVCTDTNLGTNVTAKYLKQ